MEFIVVKGAPPSLGKDGERVSLSRSQAVYHELRGHVVRPSRLPIDKHRVAPQDEDVVGLAALAPQDEGVVSDPPAPPKKRRRRKS